jgi:hypothetical protein
MLHFILDHSLHDAFMGDPWLELDLQLVDAGEVEQNKAGHMVEVVVDVLDGELGPPANLADGRIAAHTPLLLKVGAHVANYLFLLID